MSDKKWVVLAIAGLCPVLLQIKQDRDIEYQKNRVH